MWNEKHKSVKEISELWGLSESVIRGVFANDPEVIAIERPETRGKRGYKTLRIPESAISRAHKTLTRKSRPSGKAL